MVQYDEEMERYLKEFRPQAIRKLELAPQSRTIVWRWLSSAAAMAVCAGGLLWFAHRELTRPKETASVRALGVSARNQQQYRATLALTMLATADNEKFDTLLAEASRKSLPGFQGEHSGLKVLAKD
jgi:hypothetical protein